ncbi:MAG: hypothetical protein ABI867_20730 [Kofleriaceae bacterium]
MRSALAVGLLVIAAACGSSSKPPPATPAPVAPVAVVKVAAPVVEDTRLVLANKVMAALAGGQTESLVQLAEPATPYRLAADCNFGKSGLNLDPLQIYVAAARQELAFIASRTKGLKLQVLELANKVDRTAADADTRWIKKGTAWTDKCTAKQDILVHDIKVKIRAQRDNKPAVEQTISISALELDNRWFLVKAPMRIKEKETKTDIEAMIKKIGDFRDRMCKCTDKPCAEKVQEELTAWGTEIARNSGDYDPDERPDPDQARRMTDTYMKYSECGTRLLAP